MDPERYAKVRELFLAVDELPREQQLELLRSKTNDDQELISEVLSLLDEHDIESARVEGDSAKAPAFPSSDGDASSDTKTGNVVQDSDSSLGQSNDDGVEAIVSKGRLSQASSSQSSDTQTDAPSLASDSSVSRASASAPFLPTPQSRPASGTGKKSKTASGRSRTKSRSRQKAQSDKPSTRRGVHGTGQETQHGSQRTHATPRYPNDQPRARRSAGSNIWQSRAKRHRRFNSGWLWMAAILPTALIGGWTYQKVSASLVNAARNEVVGVADSVQVSVQRFLDDQARLAETWSRQQDLREAVMALVEIPRDENRVQALKASPHSNQIHQQLITLSKTPDIKFVVWDRSNVIMASWLPDQSDIGGTVAPDGAANLTRAGRGETVLFGPAILHSDDTGFVPETDLPVMAEIVPIRDDNERVIATMLIRGFGMYQEFDSLFNHASSGGGLDVYAVDRKGTMVSNSVQATGLLTQSVLEIEQDFVACNLRASDPGQLLQRNSTVARSRQSQPLTYSVAGVSSGSSESRMDDYRNYAGVNVIGAWRWIENWQLGIVVERSSQTAFAAAGIVRFGFLSLGLLLTITALVSAARIAQRTAMAQAAVHPLSRYELESELGSGGMGVVYRAKHNQLGRATALKVLRGDRDNVEDRLRFDREAKLAASLSSPHTVTIYDYGRSDEDEAYCVMEFLKGITLYDVVARSGFQDYGRVLFILRQICDSLGEAHQLGLVHRDIKPQNVMLSLDACVGDWAVVFDFGLAKPLEPDADAYQTAETIWAGTPMYMAPERYREPNKIDPRSDIYSVGCIAYFLLSGRPPFIECDPESLFALVLTEQPISIGVHRDQTVPEELVQLVNRCMSKSTSDRFQTIESLAGELDQLIKMYPWSVDQSRSWWRIHGEEIT